MLSSFQNVHENFYKKLFGEPILKEKNFKDYKHKDFKVYQTVGVVGSQGFSQEERERYPIIICTPFTPVPSEDFITEVKTYLAAQRDTDDDGIIDTVTEYFHLAEMHFRYEVNICTKDSKHHDALVEWFCKNFMARSQKSFVFNSTGIFTTVFGDDDIGDIVGNETSFIADPQRSDGVRETIYEINLYPYMQMISPVDGLPTIQNIVINYATSS